MLKALSKSGTLLQLIVFLAIGALLWFPAFVHPPGIASSKLAGPLFTMLSAWFDGSLFWPVLTSAILLVFQAFILHTLLSSNDLIPRDCLVESVVLLVLLSWNPSVLSFNPAVPALLFVLVAIYMIMRMYGNDEPYQYVFTAALSIAVASLFYLPAAWFITGVWISHLTYRIASWREWFISILGFVVPFLYVFSYYYWMGELSEGWIRLSRAIMQPFSHIEHMADYEIFTFVLLGITMLITLLITINGIQDKLISIRRKAWIIVDFALAGTGMMLFTFNDFRTSHIFILVPAVFFISYAIIMVKRSKIVDWLVTAVLIIAVSIHFFL
ncbi:MAG TPA: hypothetical protein PLP88_08720 [Bacteroidales bacterium]|nr:hypothetical protein [Bacteroidales bacterium]